MGVILFWLWVILAATFEDYRLAITICAAALFAVFKLVPVIIRRISENRIQNKKYKGIIKDITPKLYGINLDEYQSQLQRLEEIYKTEVAPYKVVLKDTAGKSINICPKCEGYMKIARNRYGIPFLGCSNYPNCRSSKDYNEISNIRV